MKKFLLKCLFFFLILLVITSGCDYLIDDILKNSDNMKYKRWRSLSEPINAEVLIVGSSRASHHVDPSIIDSILHVDSYNIGITGGPIELSDAAWKIYRSHNKKKPSLVLCNIDFLWLGTYPISNMKTNYYPYYRDSCFSAVIKELDPPLTELYIPGVKYIGARKLIIDNLRRSNLDPDSLTYIRKGAVLTSWKYREGSIYPPARHFKKSKKRVGLLENFLGECRNEGIQVIFFKSPIQQVAYKDFSGIDRSFALIDSLAATWQIPVLDYTDMTDDSFYYTDPMHLNYKGARLLSVRLANDVDTLLTKLQIKLR